MARNINSLKKAENELRKDHEELDRRFRDRTMALTKAREQLNQKTRALSSPGIIEVYVITGLREIQDCVQ